MTPERHRGSAADAGIEEFFQQNYWTFWEVRRAYAAAAQPTVRFWWSPDETTDYERTIVEAIRGVETVLDVGAGNHMVKRKLQAAGLDARYLTLDPSTEFEQDFHDLAEVPDGSCDAILALEVIEHIPLSAFFEFVGQLLSKLSDSGVLVLSTPNADYIASIWAADFTHVHAYRGVDLAALLHLYGFESSVFRVAWRSPHDSIRERLRFQLARLLTRGVLQVDYARGIMVVARRTADPRLPEPARP